MKTKAELTPELLRLLYTSIFVSAILLNALKPCRFIQSWACAA
jgi:hypothetical protein